MIAFTGCWGPTYSHTSDATFNFAKLEKYQIVLDKSEKKSVRIHPSVRQQIDKSITEHMQRLGYQRGFPLPPDFTVSYRLESVWDPSLSEDEIRQRLGFSGSHFPDADPRARDYQVLSLVVEITALPEHKVVWSGRADDVQYDMGKTGWSLVSKAERIIREFPPEYK